MIKTYFAYAEHTVLQGPHLLYLYACNSIHFSYVK